MAKGLGECEWAEEAADFPAEDENGEEADGDDEEAEEETGAYFFGCFDDDIASCAGVAGNGDGHGVFLFSHGRGVYGRFRP